ncbi:MAG: hypothetical protein Hals2KO_02620 [Halioglobus sp.]
MHPISEELLKKQLVRTSRQSFWLGVVCGVVLGALIGFAVGYSQKGQTVVIPLTEGVRTELGPLASTQGAD